MCLRCVSFYRPTPNKGGPSSVWSQHKSYFQLRGDDRDPCLAFYEDLRGEMQAWLAEGDQIVIGGDLNDHALKPTVSLFFAQLGLHNLIFQRHDPLGAPTTSSRNEQNKILDSFWGTANISVARCGYCHPKAFQLGGHSVVWMDLTYSCALGHYPPPPTPFRPAAFAWIAPKPSKHTKTDMSLLSGGFPFCHASLPSNGPCFQECLSHPSRQRRRKLSML